MAKFRVRVKDLVVRDYYPEGPDIKTRQDAYDEIEGMTKEELDQCDHETVHSEWGIEEINNPGDE